MDSALQTMLENGANRKLTITFPDNTSLADLTDEVEEKSVSFSHILCGDKDLDFGANPSQFQFTAHGIGDISGEHIRAYWTVYLEDETSVEEYGFVYLFDGFVASAEIQPDRESRKVVAYDILKKAQDIDVSDWWRNQFQPTVKSEYKGAYSTETTYSYWDTFKYEDAYYRWLVKSTDYVMVNDKPVLASTVLNGKTMTEILSDYPFYVQALTDYDIYQYRNKAVSAMYQALVQNVLGTGYEGDASVNALMTVKYSPVSNMKASDFLKYYAQISGAFVCVNPETGNLYLQRLGSESVNYSNNYEALKSNYAEYSAPVIGKVQLVGTNGVVYGEYGAGQNPYQIQNPLITERAANTQARYIYNIVHALAYVPAEIQAGFSLPIKPGARITIATRSGDILRTYALENSMSGIQMVEQRLSAKGNESREEKTYTPLQEYINRKQAEETAKAQAQAQRAEAEARNAEASSAARTAEKSGLYITKVPVTGGGYVYYLHDKAALADSQVRIEISGSAIRFSTDGGQTYTTELKIDGETITQILSAVGVNAEWIKAGTLTAMVLQGVKGEIGNWTIQDYALFSEFISAIQGIDYKVILRAPAQSLYERDGVSVDNGTVSVDSETGQITATPSANGSCTVKIKTNKLLAMSKIGLTIKKSYNNKDASRRLVMRYFWNGFDAPYSNPYSVTWAASEPNYNIGNTVLYISSGSTTEQRIQGADYAYGELSVTMPNCTAGTDYTFDIQMAVDDKEVETWVPDNLPDGFEHDMVLAIYDETNGEIAFALRGDGEVYSRQGVFDLIDMNKGENGEKLQIRREHMLLTGGYALGFEGGGFGIYADEEEGTSGGWPIRKLIVESSGENYEEVEFWKLYPIELRPYIYLFKGRLAEVLNFGKGKVNTDEDSDGRSIWLSSDSPGEVFLGEDSSNGKKARVRYGEDNDGNTGLIIDGGDYDKNVDMSVQGSIYANGPIRESASASIAYTSTLTLTGEAKRSGNTCWFCFDVSSPFGTAMLYHGQDVKVAQITNQSDYPLAEVVVPINTDRSDFGDQAYARVNTSGEVYVHQYGNTNGAYASLNLFWLCA